MGWGGELTCALIPDLTNLNKALEGKEAGSIVELQKGAIKAGGAIRNNGGGFYNHGMFFESMTSPATSGAPSPALAKAIDESFGSMDEMKKQFSDAAAKRFGSGWAWLGVKPDGKVTAVCLPPGWCWQFAVEKRGRTAPFFSTPCTCAHASVPSEPAGWICCVGPCDGARQIHLLSLHAVSLRSHPPPTRIILSWKAPRAKR